jgi:D-lactate dehydrogenase (cytochrome)
MQYGKRQMRLWVTDVCVPLSHLAQVISETETDFAQSSVRLPCPIVGHVADGNFHCLVPFNASDVLEVAEMRRLNERLIQRALAYEGTASGEHGVGMGKIDALYQVRTHARTHAHEVRTHTIIWVWGICRRGDWRWCRR